MGGNNIRDLRRRIRSVRNTSQLTRAMKMVSAAKLRRAQEAMLAARPYSAALRRVLGSIALRAQPELHPLLASRPEKAIDLIVISGDRGLAGAFNANILRAAEQWRRERTAAGTEVHLTLIGRKAGDFYRRRPQVPVREVLQDVFRGFDFARAQGYARVFEQRFTSGETDGVYLAYNEFRSVVSQHVVVEPLLPLAGVAGQQEGVPRREGVDYIYEPEPALMMGRLLSRFVAFGLYHALLESVAAEHGARMSAMDNATRNAGEMIARLTLQMNRMRQAAITKEIIEVVSGAESLG